MQGSRFLLSAHRLLTSHAAICNAFFDQRHMASRPPLRLLRALSDTIWVAARLPLQSQTRLAGTCERNSVGQHICIPRALTRQLSQSLSLSSVTSRSSHALTASSGIDNR
jgi:hypothetical protein